MLAGEPYRSRIPWECVHLFWGDERCVPPDHPESNFRMVQETLLAQVPLPPENIHQIPVDQGSPEAAATAYERIIQRYFQLEDGELPEFDLVLLGLGEDGHTASLFPHAAAVHERRRLVVATSGGSPNLPRVTLTVPVLNHARRLVWLVTGAQKAPIVRKVLQGPEQLEEIPAQRVRALQGTSLWLLDHEAAKEVSVDCSGNGDPANA
jgi:6-phosphogluconolactonase